MTKRICVEVVAVCALLCGCSYVAETDEEEVAGAGGRAGAGAGGGAGAGAGGSSGRGGSGGRSGSGGGGMGGVDPGEDAGADPDSDGGSEAGSGGGDPGCIDRAIAWGLDGGFVAYRDLHRLEPCSAFSITRSMPGNPGADLNCENEVGASADVSADDIDAALAHADVRAALAAAPVLYGRDLRPVDGTVLRIEVAAAVVEIGSDCGGQTGCADIPGGVQALRNALEALATQQRVLPDCDALP